MTNTKFNRANCRPKVSGVHFGKSPLNNLIDDFINGDFFKTTEKVINNGLSRYPVVNVKETDDAFHIEVVAPGFKKKDFSLLVEGEQLIIKTNLPEVKVEDTGKETDETTKTPKAETTKPKVKFIRKEFTAPSFKRSFTLPENVELETIKADYKAGILLVTLTKKEVEIVKPITIEVS